MANLQINVPPATQDEVDAGTVTNKYVSPKTLADWPGGGGGGTPGGIDGDWQINLDGVFGGVTPASNWGTLFSTPTLTNFNAWLSGDDVAGLGAANTFTNTNSFSNITTFVGAIVNTPTSDSGTEIDVTKVTTTKSLSSDVTETFSATPTIGTRIIRQYSADGTDRIVTPDNGSGTVYFYDLGSTFSSFVVKANTSRTVVYERQSGRWAAYGTGTLNAIAPLGTFAAPVTTNPYSLSVNNAYGSILSYGATGEIDLPAGSAGMNLVIVNTGSFTITIDPNGSQAIVREGTTQSGGVSMTLSAGAGNYVVLFFDGTNWQTLGFRGTLAQGS